MIIITLIIMMMMEMIMMIIIIIVIYNTLIDALSVHMIHINLNAIFHRHVEHSPANATYRKYYGKEKQKSIPPLWSLFVLHFRIVCYSICKHGPPQSPKGVNLARLTSHM